MAANDRIDFDEVRKYIEDSSEDTKIYIGSDSKRFRKTVNGKEVWFAKYASVVCVHHHDNGIGRGCHVFAENVVERDYGVVERSGKIKNLKLRMLTEVTKALEVFEKIWEAVGDRVLEIHIDINTDPNAESNIALKEARGYVMGVTGKEAIFKPNALAASFAADAKCNGLLN